MRVFNVETGQLVSMNQDHDDAVYSISFSPDGTRPTPLVSLTFRILFHIPSFTPTPIVLPHSQPSLIVGTNLASGSLDKTVKIWDFLRTPSKFDSILFLPTPSSLIPFSLFLVLYSPQTPACLSPYSLT